MGRHGPPPPASFEPPASRYRPPMTYRAGIATRSRILDAARGLLSEGGLEAATVKAICARAGILPGSFYNLFKSKEEAVLTVVRDAIASAEPVTAGPEETVADLVNAFVRFVNTEPVIARVYLIIAVSGGVTDPSIRRRVLRHHQARVERFSNALTRIATPAEPPGQRKSRSPRGRPDRVRTSCRPRFRLRSRQTRRRVIATVSPASNPQNCRCSPSGHTTTGSTSCHARKRRRQW